jgi:IgA Peptidase M64/FG-GAP-like repeat
VSTADGSVVGVTKIVDRGPNDRRWNLVLVAEGYRSAELPQFASDAQSIADTLLATPPFDRLRSAINVHRIDVSSTDSGADDPTACGGTGVTAATYFDASFCNFGIRRLLLVDTLSVLNVVNARVPEWHAILVTVNSTVYGGAGGTVGVYSLAPGASLIALHELGHTAFALADEYEYWAGCGIDTDRDNHPAVEPSEPNVTTSTDRATIKWRDLIAAETAVPTTSNPDCTTCDPQASPVPAGTVGAFEGAHYFHCRAFRPEFDCRMRTLNAEFCAVCRREIRRAIARHMPWSDPKAVPGWLGAEAQGADIALSDLDGNGRPDLIVFHIDNPGGENHGYYRIGWNLDNAGDVTGGWSDVKAVPGWFGAEDQGAGIALADIDGNGRPDLVVFHVDNPGGENHGYYRIGWNLDTAGDVSGGWSGVKAVPGWFGAENQGAGIALDDISANGRPDLVIFHIDNPDGENHGYYRIGWNLNMTGDVTGALGDLWSAVKPVPGWYGAEDQGAAVAVGDARGTGQTDFVVYHIDNPGGENRGYYRIGRRINFGGDIADGTTAPKLIPGWFGAENQGGGIALADISGTGRRDLVVFHVDNPGGENQGYYRIGWNLSSAGEVL